jgi:hypothetical protein
MIRTQPATSDEPRVVVSAQMPMALRVELERRAREGDRTLSAQLRRAIAKHLGHEDDEDHGHDGEEPS